MIPKSYTVTSRYNGITYRYERMKAEKHYGPHAAGSVLLRDGVPAYHASPGDVNRFIRDTLVDAFDTGHTITLPELSYPNNLRIGLPPTGITHAQAMASQVADMIYILRGDRRKTTPEPAAGSTSK